LAAGKSSLGSRLEDKIAQEVSKGIAQYFSSSSPDKQHTSSHPLAALASQPMPATTPEPPVTPHPAVAPQVGLPYVHFNYDQLQAMRQFQQFQALQQQSLAVFPQQQIMSGFHSSPATMPGHFPASALYPVDQGYAANQMMPQQLLPHGGQRISPVKDTQQYISSSWQPALSSRPVGIDNTQVFQQQQQQQQQQPQHTPQQSCTQQETSHSQIPQQHADLVSNYIVSSSSNQQSHSSARGAIPGSSQQAPLTTAPSQPPSNTVPAVPPQIDFEQLRALLQSHPGLFKSP
jgi:hypothetical protein